MKTLRKLVYSAFFLVLIAATLWFVHYYYQFRHAPLIVASAPNSAVTTIKVPPGTGIDNLLNKLYHSGLLTHKHLAKLYSNFYIWRDHLRTGEYAIEPGTSLADLLAKIIKGDVYVRQFAIIEGWRYEDLRVALNRDTNLKSSADQSVAQDQEGKFFPDTYFYTWGDSDSDILRQAQAKMQRILAESWANREADLPYQNPYQALIAASLIEKETALNNEKALVASVIVNRLGKNMPLQIDPAVIYGLGYSHHQKLKYEDLKTDTPYNTYKIKGLPPTPIAFPSKASIVAALHPAKTDYLFYVANGTGGHTFTRSFAEHIQAKKSLHIHQETVHDTKANSEG